MGDVGRPVMAGSTQIDMTVPSIRTRRLTRMPKNPMDKCTIVSIFPKKIEEYKHTIFPGKYVIGEGTAEKPAILVVEASSWYKDIDSEQPLIEIPVGSLQIAESFVKDYCNGMLGCNMSDAMPGLFYVTGEETQIGILAKYKSSINEAKVKQDNWYKILVRIADALWARTNGNPLAISDEARIAARSLGMNEKPWLKDFFTVQMVSCRACGSLKNPAFPVCPTCKAIDADNPLSKDLRFAV